ncbi:MAG: outer membrane beta-barrel protein [Thermoanaerobaculia bacterium]
MRKYFLFLFLSISSLGFSFLREGTSEFEFFAGTHLGDNFVIHQRYGYTEEKELNDSFLLGMRGSYFFEEHFAIEFTLAGTQSDTTDGDNFDLYYYHGNFLFQFGDGAFSPFFTIGIGATTLRYPSYTADMERYNISDTKFSWNWGGGFKIYFSDNFALRTDLRAYFINLNKNDDCWDDDDCWRWEEELVTTEFSLGFVFKF